MANKLIWFGHPHAIPAFEIAAKCKLITHLIVATGHYLDQPLTDPRVATMIEIAQGSGKPWILSRCLWREGAGNKESDLWSYAYYKGVVGNLQAEAAKLGCQTCLDTEPYTSTVRPYFIGDRELSATRTALIKMSVYWLNRPVDYIMPAGAPKGHLYTTLARLGKNRICEQTYFDIEGTGGPLKDPYEITGLKLGFTSPCYHPRRLKERILRPGQPPDIMIYTDTEDALKVIELLEAL